MPKFAIARWEQNSSFARLICIKGLKQLGQVVQIAAASN